MSLKYNFECYNKNNIQEIKLLNEDSYNIPMLLFDKNLCNMNNNSSVKINENSVNLTIISKGTNIEPLEVQKLNLWWHKY